MVESILGEVRFFGICLFDGFILAMVYDLFRILRRVIKHSRVITGIEDVLFGVAAGIEIFAIDYMYNNGVLRGFVFIGFGVGIIFYNRVFSKAVVNTVSGVLNYIKRFILRIMRSVGRCAGNVWKKILIIFVKIRQKRRKNRTNLPGKN